MRRTYAQSNDMISDAPEPAHKQQRVTRPLVAATQPSQLNMPVLRMWTARVRARDSCLARWTYISGSRTISAIQNPSGSSAERALPHTQASRSIEICVALVEDHRVREPLRVERKQTVFATWSIIISGVGSRLIVWLSALCFFFVFVFVFVCWRRRWTLCPWRTGSILS